VVFPRRGDEAGIGRRPKEKGEKLEKKRSFVWTVPKGRWGGLQESGREGWIENRIKLMAVGKKSLVKKWSLG